MSRVRFLPVLVFAASVTVGALGASALPAFSPAPSAAVEPGTACDHDGVTAGYTTTHADSGYVVTDVEIGDLAPQCLGIDLGVALLADSSIVAIGGTQIDGDAETVEVTPAPPASRVNGIAVTVAGSDLPVGSSRPDRLPAPAFVQNLAAISPNGDGLFDDVSIDLDFDHAARWDFSLTAVSGGDELVHLTGTGESASISWDGRASGAVADEGAYRWTVTADDDEGMKYSSVGGRVVVDRSAPVIVGLKGRPDPFHLREDIERISFSVREDLTAPVDVIARLIRPRHEDRTGAVVHRKVLRSFDLGSMGNGDGAKIRWDGRNGNGHYVRPGRALLIIRASDSVANRTINRSYRLRVGRN